MPQIAPHENWRDIMDKIATKALNPQSYSARKGQIKAGYIGGCGILIYITICIVSRQLFVSK